MRYLISMAVALFIIFGISLIIVPVVLAILFQTLWYMLIWVLPIALIVGLIRLLTDLV